MEGGKTMKKKNETKTTRTAAEDYDYDYEERKNDVAEYVADGLTAGFTLAQLNVD